MPSKKWDDEESGSESSASTSAAPVAVVGRRKFEDEEDDNDVLDSWDAAEDSEVEREKEKKAAAAREKAAAEAAANKKSKAQRIEEHRLARQQQMLDEEESDEDETEAEKRERLRRTEKEADLMHAQSLLGDDFGDIGISNSRKGKTPGAAVVVDPKDPNNTVNIGALPLFNPQTKLQFETLRNTMVPIITASSKKAHYGLFLQEFAKQLAADLPSDQIKKVASSLTALSNEKMKAEKASLGAGKKSKAAKTKTSLVTNRDNAVETHAYENDDFGDDDFM